MEKHKDNEARHRMFCEMVDVFKSHPEAQIPTKSHSDDAGHDLYASRKPCLTAVSPLNASASVKGFEPVDT